MGIIPSATPPPPTHTFFPRRAFHLRARSFSQRCYSAMDGITLCLMLHLVSRRSACILFTTVVGCSFHLAL